VRERDGVAGRGRSGGSEEVVHGRAGAVIRQSGRV
jgi:hypothetical protein